MNAHSHTPWSRLTAAARRAPVSAVAGPDELVAPVGFSTRVVALAGVRPSAGLFASRTFERLAGRALAFSCAGALAVTVWASVPTALEAGPAADTAAAADYYLDPVGAVLEIVES